MKSHSGLEDHHGAIALHGLQRRRNNRADETNHWNPLPTIQRVSHKYHPLISQPLQQRRRIKPRKLTFLRLPPPIPVPQILPPKFLTRQLIGHENTLTLLVKRIRLIVKNPLPTEQVASPAASIIAAGSVIFRNLCSVLCQINSDEEKESSQNSEGSSESGSYWDCPSGIWTCG